MWGYVVVVVVVIWTGVRSAGGRIEMGNYRGTYRGNVRMLIHEAGAVVDLIVDDEVQVLLGVVGLDLLVGKLLCSHCGVYRAGIEIDRGKFSCITVRAGEDRGFDRWRVDGCW